MPTIPPTYPARNNGEQSPLCFAFRFQFANIGAFAAGAKTGLRLPARSFLRRVQLYKTTAFNSATTDTLQFGVTQTGAELLAATTIQGTGYVDLTAAAGLGMIAAAIGEVDVWARYLQSGAAATVGDLTAILEYYPEVNG